MAAYTIQPDSGSYSVIGFASVDRILSIAAGSFVLTGTAVPLNLGRIIVAASGAYVLTGKLVSIARISAEPGSYQLQGQAASLETGNPKIAIVSGSYAITPGATFIERAVPSDRGEYALTGQAVTLTRSGSGNTLNAFSGVYTLTGVAAGLEATVTIETGDYNITGTPITFRTGKSIIANSRAFTLGGQAVTLKQSKRIIVDSGSYSYTPQVSQLVYSSATDIRIVINHAAFTLIGYSATLRLSRWITASPGAYTYTGFITGTAIQADLGAYSITGSPINFQHIPRLAADSGTYVLTGQDAQTRQVSLFELDGGVYQLTGQLASLTVLYPLSADQGFYLISSTGAELRATQIVAESGSYFITPTPSNDHNLSTTRPDRWRTQPAIPGHSIQQPSPTETWDNQPDSPGV